MFNVGDTVYISDQINPMSKSIVIPGDEGTVILNGVSSLNCYLVKIKKNNVEMLLNEKELTGPSKTIRSVAEDNKCNCDFRDLMIRGCKCGGV